MIKPTNSLDYLKGTKKIKDRGKKHDKNKSRCKRPKESN